MINFHKYGYLDIKKLAQFFDNKSIKLMSFNPIWLYLWSDIYHPEIAFKGNSCYIRINVENVGLSYFPPLGDEVSMYDAILEIQENAKEDGIDFNMGPVDESYYFKVLNQKINLVECKKLESYTYLCDDIAFMKPSKVKKAKKRYDKFNKLYKNTYLKNIGKEDFTVLLEFINNWNMTSSNLSDKEYYSMLNVLKASIEHLYELNLIGNILMDDEKIYGYVIGSIFGNTAYIYQVVCDDIEGLKETLISSFAKTCGIAARYLELDSNGYDSLDLKTKIDLNPFAIEKFYSTYNIE